MTFDPATQKDAKQRMIEATIEELDSRGPTQLRLKRVAQQAGVSQSLVNTHFGGREGLIAAAIAHRYPKIMDGILHRFADVMAGVGTREEFAAALRTIALDTLSGDRQVARHIRLTALAIAEHNDEVSSIVDEVQQQASATVIQTVTPLAEQGLLAPGLTAVTFCCFWYSLLFGQVIVETDPNFAAEAEEWLVLVEVLINATLCDASGC